MNPAPIAESSLFLVFAALVGAGMGLPISEDAVLLFTGALTDLITGIGNCIDFDGTTTCTPGF